MLTNLLTELARDNICRQFATIVGILGSFES